MLEKRKFGLSSFSLRVIAMLLMLCDHVWATVIAGNMWMTEIGRLAFPIFAFLISEGFYHTKDRKKYLLRLTALALISEIPFNLMCEGSIISPFHQNVIWTFIIALLTLILMEKAGKGSVKGVVCGFAATALGFIAGTLLMTDYGGAGVLMVIVFSVFRERKPLIMIAQAILIAFINLKVIGGMFIPLEIFGAYIEFPLQGFAIFALPLIWLYNGEQGYHSKAARTAWYLFYPVHILVLSLIGMFL